MSLKDKLTSAVLYLGVVAILVLAVTLFSIAPP